jgi:hypothetical protein
MNKYVTGSIKEIVCFIFILFLIYKKF